MTILKNVHEVVIRKINIKRFLVLIAVMYLPI